MCQANVVVTSNLGRLSGFLCKHNKSSTDMQLRIHPSSLEVMLFQLKMRHIQWEYFRLFLLASATLNYVNEQLRNKRLNHSINRSINQYWTNPIKSSYLAINLIRSFGAGFKRSIKNNNKSVAYSSQSPIKLNGTTVKPENKGDFNFDSNWNLLIGAWNMLF